MIRLPRTSLVLLLAAALSCAGSGTGPRAPSPRAAALDNSANAPEQAPVGVDATGTYLQTNITRGDGSHGFMHVTPDDMPWVVAIGYPKRPPKYASRKRAREVAIEAMQMWEAAIQPQLPWFQLEFVEDDPAASVQVEWKRRITGPWGGFGRMSWSTASGSLRVGGSMQVSTTPDNHYTLEIDEVAVLIGHEFGHILGLGHCLSCDSVMNYSWATRGRVLVTDLDVKTFLALIEQPNAYSAR